MLRYIVLAIEKLVRWWVHRSFRNTVGDSVSCRRCTFDAGIRQSRMLGQRAHVAATAVPLPLPQPTHYLVLVLLVHRWRRFIFALRRLATAITSANGLPSPAGHGLLCSSMNSLRRPARRMPLLVPLLLTDAQYLAYSNVISFRPSVTWTVQRWQTSLAL